MSKSHNRDTILDALSMVIGERGLVQTSLDAVAERAGISKGGLLYYFANKNDLLTSMVERYEATFMEERDKLAATLPPTKHRIFKATIILMLRNLEATRAVIPNLSTILDDAALRARVGEFKRRLAEEASVGINPSKVAVGLLLVDGLWNDIRFNPVIYPQEILDNVIAELLAYVDAADE